MSNKVKVFTIAKRYGFKSADFVNVLRDIGFPVTSYQASLDDWDVPVVEERLLRAGLIDISQTEGGNESSGGDGPTTSWDELEANQEAREDEEPEDEAAPEDEEQDSTEEEDPPESAKKEDPPTEEIAAPTPKPKAKEESEEDSRPSPEEEAPTPTTSPTPKPKSGASKVGKIDLAALGLIKSRQQATKKSATFTDIRDHQSSRRTPAIGHRAHADLPGPCP